MKKIALNKKNKYKKQLIYILSLFTGVILILFSTLIVYNSINKKVNNMLKTFEKVQEEKIGFISRSMEFIEKGKYCKMTSGRKIELLSFIFNKAIEYRNRYYIKPTFILYHINQESGFDEKALGRHKERGLFQYHPLKIKDACLIYKISEEEFLNDLEKQVDFYFILMTDYLNCYDGNMEKALLTYNCGPGIIEAYNNDVEYLKRVVYTENKTNPRKPYSDTI